MKKNMKKNGKRIIHRVVLPLLAGLAIAFISFFTLTLLSS
jgi:hypothetical protein